MRATELGDLLKETPLLESKLRKPTSSGSEESLMSPSSNCTGDKGMKTSSRKKSVKRRIFDNDETSDSLYQPGDDDLSELMISTSPYQTTTSFTSSSSCIGSPRVTVIDPHAQAVRLQNLLQNLQFTFSFQVC
jgi:hypothetical protein